MSLDHPHKKTDARQNSWKRFVHFTMGCWCASEMVETHQFLSLSPLEGRKNAYWHHDCSIMFFLMLLSITDVNYCLCPHHFGSIALTILFFVLVLATVLIGKSLFFRLRKYNTSLPLCTTDRWNGVRWHLRINLALSLSSCVELESPISIRASRQDTTCR